ncbi:helicase RepA family protein [Roseateles sp.]|uniref:helicase RepA family protein n=1 Tax=Roseateles sp. TaxID=1971397 RepID=UPI0031D608A6
MLSKALPPALNILRCLETEPPSIDFVLPGFLAGTVGGLVAAGGVGKSTLALQAAMAIAVDVAGADLLGLDTQKHGRVVILAGEDPEVVLHLRINTIASGLSASARKTLAQALTIFPAVGHGVDIMDNEWFEALRRTCVGARLVVVDTLTRFHRRDENNTADAKAVMATLERLASLTGAAVLYLHHVSKAAAMGGMADLQQAARGSSVFVDNARWLAFMASMTAEEAKAMRLAGNDRWRYVRMGVSKPNYDAPTADRWYRRGDGGLLLPWDGLSEGPGAAPAADVPNTDRRAGRTARSGEVTYV